MDVFDFIGWAGLTPSERLIATAGGIAALGAWAALTMTARALFGGLRLRRKKKGKAKRAAKGKGRR